MTTQLSIVEIEGKRYFDDTRLKEYRQVDNPHERVPYEAIGDRKVKVITEQKELLSKKRRGDHSKHPGL